MANYIWSYTLEERGLKELNWRDWGNDLYFKKSQFVEQYLNPAIAPSNCGWDHIVYKIFENKMGGKEEYVLICPNRGDDNGARYINISANSLSAIAQAVWKNID